MAITIQESPQVYNPVYNPVTFTVLSTNNGQDNFEYVLDLYLSGGGSYTRRFTKPSDNTTAGGGRAFFDISKILQGYVTHNILRSDAGFATNTNSYVSFVAKFGEQYGPTSGITVYADLTVDSTRYAYNAVFDSPDWRDYEDDDYVLADVQKKFLTNFPDSGKVRSDERRWAYMLTSGTNVVDHMVIKTYDSSDALIQTVRVNNQHKGLSDTDQRFLRFPIGTNMNGITDTILQGALPVLTASVAKYTIQTNNATSGVTSELRTFVVEDICTIHNAFTFHFLNKHGGFDTFTFIRRSDLTSTVERSEYKKIQGGIGGDSTKSAGTWGYDNSDRGRVNFYTRINDKISVHSDWVDEATMEWLEELVYSPEVYLDDTTHGFIAVNILNPSFDKRQRVNDKLFSLQLDFTYGYHRYRQSR